MLTGQSIEVLNDAGLINFMRLFLSDGLLGPLQNSPLFMQKDT